MHYFPTGRRYDAAELLVTCYEGFANPFCLPQKESGQTGFDLEALPGYNALETGYGAVVYCLECCSNSWLTIDVQVLLTLFKSHQAIFELYTQNPQPAQCHHTYALYLTYVLC